MAVAAEADAYEWALARVPELEVGLASAVTALERCQADNAALKDIHTDLTTAYKRLHEQHERLRLQLRREQEERHRLADEQQRQQARWRQQLEARAREVEELQSRPSHVPVRELDSLRLRLAEEIEEPYNQRIRALEAHLAAEQRRTAESQRQARLQQAEAQALHEELREEVSELKRLLVAKEQAHQRDVASLQAEVRRAGDSDGMLSKLRAQLQDQEVRAAGLQRTLQEHEAQSERERAASAAELRARVEEASTVRRRAHELQVRADQEERRNAQLEEELEAARREQARLSVQLEQARTEARTALERPPDESEALRGELAALRAGQAAERERHTRALQAAEAAHRAAADQLQRVEARLRQLQQEKGDAEREWQAEREELAEAERKAASEAVAAKVKLEGAEKEAEARKLSWREREQALVRQNEDASARAEVLGDELVQSQAAQEEFSKRLQAAQEEFVAARERHSATLQALTEKHAAVLEAVQREAASLQQRIVSLERERTEQASAAEAVRHALRRQEQRGEMLQAELASISAKLDAERAAWAKDADESHRSFLVAEEQRRAAAVKALQEDHKRQALQMHAATKKALQKSARKRMELKQRLQDLTRRMSKLQQERQLAVRVCEENRAAYEVRLAELGAAANIGRFSGGSLADAAALSQYPVSPRAASAASSLQRRELRAISERLEQHAVYLRERRGAAGSGGALAIPAGIEPPHAT